MLHDAAAVDDDDDDDDDDAVLLPRISSFRLQYETAMDGVFAAECGADVAPCSLKQGPRKTCVDCAAYEV